MVPRQRGARRTPTTATQLSPLGLSQLRSHPSRADARPAAPCAGPEPLSGHRQLSRAPRVTLQQGLRQTRNAQFLPAPEEEAMPLEQRRGRQQLTVPTGGALAAEGVRLNPKA